MNWVFPRNDGGRDSGFHDAGVETFKGGFHRNLARELIQNSLDARLTLKEPVHVKFELVSLERSQIPEVDYLQQTFRRCASFWKGQIKVREFFETAGKIAGQRKITALKVSDYNTTGVPGSDTDRTKNWYHLIRCTGSSSKLSGEGGSFGIGKNAPFAASRLRTVFYSTRTPDGQVAFQGVSTLVSHKLPDGSIAQPTGFLGGKRGKSIRVPGKIPHIFRRTECGLDTVVLEYPAAENWQDNLVYSVLDNFWPAIDFGDLVVTVGKQTIDKSNLRKLLSAFSGQEDFTAHLFYQAYKSPTHRYAENLPMLKKCSLHLIAGDMDLPKKVAMVRKTGMVIYQRGWLRSLLPFCGVFLCRNDTGNRALREMEPPRHDEWDPDHPEPGANKKIEIEYMSFIRECVGKLVPVDDSKVMSIPDLNRFLPDDDETEEESLQGSESASRSETPERSPLPEVIPGRKIDPRQRRMQPDSAKPDSGDEETDTSESGGEGGGPEGGKNDTGAGRRSGGGVKGEGSGGAETGGAGGAHSKLAIPIQYRTFAQMGGGGVYNLLVRGQTKSGQQANLTVSTIGDDQESPADIIAARLADGAPIPLVGPGVFGPIVLSDGVTHRIEITLSTPTRVAMEVSAHEA